MCGLFVRVVCVSLGCVMCVRCVFVVYCGECVGCGVSVCGVFFLFLIYLY